MTNKETYIEFCKWNRDLPVFLTDWWMDSVCAGKQWDVLLSLDVDGNIRAAMPYLLRQRFRLRYIVMPQMTQIGGIWLREDVRTDADLVQSICADFARQLDGLRLSYYYQHYPLGSPAPAVMGTLGFKVRERVTYRIEDLTDLDRVINTFSKNKKRQLQRALSLHTDMTLSAEDFYRFHEHCMREQAKQISYTREFLLVIERKASRLGQCQIIAIRNADNDLTAAAFVVWDAHTMYYLIPCYSPAYKDSGAGALLVLETLKLAREKGVAFDFEGSMIRGVANHYKQFGSTPTAYYSVERYYHWFFRLATLLNRFRERKMHG